MRSDQRIAAGALLVLMVVAGCSAAPSVLETSSPSVVAVPTPVTTPLPSAPASQSALPEPSSAGWIAFLTGSPLGAMPRSLAVISPDGGEAMPILPDGFNVASGPSWSPDGRALAFGRSHCLPAEVASGCQRGASIAVITYDSAMGSDLIHDLLLSPDGVYAMWPDWSPDGTRIAFIRGTAGQVDPFELVVMDADGQNPVVLETGLEVIVGPDWAPDGSRIAFSGRATWDDSGNQIYTIAADGSDLRQVTPTDLGNAVSPAWSPVGSRLSFTLGDQIWWTPTAAWDPAPFPVAGQRIDAVWSPDGLRMAFLGDGQQIGWTVIPLNRTDPIDELLLDAHGSELDWGASTGG